METTFFDEKQDYEHRRQCRHRKNRLSTTTSSKAPSTTSSSCSFISEKSSLYNDHNAPPRYSYAFYNTLEDKPLPALPKEAKHVRFVLQKPLPPLPCEERGGEGKGQRKRMRSNSEEGEYAWWALKRFQMNAVQPEEEELLNEKR
ncbi:hypothetical protein G7Y89_g6057 [Cudoniella acicularis]|uniref:Uncharacterized protein n=1 Tax=Cudoniella acicularis TaxID=354080 RepID=A0A8H4RMY8_9HELO|nr:hypothetical protein G7Y89_g6057 [Cudoniella acicularis]